MAPVYLTTAQRRTLSRLAHSPGTAPRIARRASLVLDSDQANRTGSPLPRGGAVWLERFRSSGQEGLKDQHRSGRPRQLDEDFRRRLIMAPLAGRSRSWSSRSISEVIGVSQSTVVRAWADLFITGRTRLAADAMPDGTLSVVAWMRTTEGSVVALRTDPLGKRRADRGEAAFMRSAIRRHLQVLLAVDVVSPRGADGSHAAKALERPGRLMFTERALASATVILCSSDAGAMEIRSTIPQASVVVVHDEDWQGLLLELGFRLSDSDEPQLRAAARRAMEWAQGPSLDFVWAPEPGTVTHAGRDARGDGTAPLATSESVAGAIVARLTDDLLAGRLRGGDHIPESQLARSMHTSRGHVREALRVLAAQGLIEIQPHRGAVIPVPDMNDVLETYALRRALGALIVRRATEAPQAGQRQLLEAAHQRMLALSRTGDAWATGDVDLDFQDVMARTSGMRRVSRMFVGLTVQLRLYVATLGVRYAYSVPDMCHDNILLMRHISEGSAQLALSAWDSKMRDAAQYMLGQLSP